MNILRFSDLCAQGKVQGKRVFIRSDLNVPPFPPSAWRWTLVPLSW